MLTRHFSLLSLLFISAAGVALVVLVHQHQVRQMEHLAQDRNVMTTRVLQNVLIEEVKQLAELAAHLPREDIAGRTEIARFRDGLVPLLQGSDIAKLKIYALNGITVFSTDPAQIGENKADNAGFQRALHGQVASELTHRDQFSAFDGVKNDLDLVSSYLPVYEGERLVAIFELYQAVNSLLQEIDEARLQTGLLVGSVLLLLFAFQWAVIRRAQAILAAHEARLESDNRQLGERVEESAQALMETRGRVAHLATHDQLTGLPNRQWFFDGLAEALAENAGRDDTLAVLLVDLDGFSDLNDNFGHDVGDRLLCDVAGALRAAVRRGDTLARPGGDEFALLLTRLGSDVDEAVRVVQSIADKLLLTLHHHYRLPAEGFAGTGSIGATLARGRGVSAAELLKQAELAMYCAKAGGRNRLTFFDPEMAEHLRVRTRLEADLRRAIAGDELVVFYQPQLRGADGRVVGAEALVRWLHPEQGLLAPDAFIGLAESSGLILPLGQWVLDTVCRQLAAWQAKPGLDALVVAVNVSVQQFCAPDFVSDVLETLRRTGAEPRRLKLELTESLFAEDIEGIVRTMETLRQSGITFSLDDFGTGYSSLAYLQRLPLDQLKIDRTFVQEIGHGDDEVSICAAIISLAHGLRLDVVAEGVETAAQRDFLVNTHRCDQLQGYLISRPLPTAGFEAFLSAGRQ